MKNLMNSCACTENADKIVFKKNMHLLTQSFYTGLHMYRIERLMCDGDRIYNFLFA